MSDEQSIEPVLPLSDAPPTPDTPDEDGSPLPEDRIGAFTSYALAGDLLELREIFAGFFERVKPDDWNRRSERRVAAWTLREVVAHLGAVAEAFNTAAVAGLAGQAALELPGITRRADLKAWNKAEIAARADKTPAQLVDALLATLSEAARQAACLEVDALAREVQTPFYNRPLTIAELFGGSLSHAGIVHAAQVANPVRKQPLWLFYRPGMMRRQLTRFFHILGLAYWPERGGELQAAIAFNASGQGGGSWLVRVGPEGGHGQIGRLRSPDLSLSFASADLLCRVFTVQTSPWRALLLRQLSVSGDLGLARRFPRLFNPT